jgi:hypothetical protein
MQELQQTTCTTQNCELFSRLMCLSSLNAMAAKVNILHLAISTLLLLHEVPR